MKWDLFILGVICGWLFAAFLPGIWLAAVLLKDWWADRKNSAR